MFEYVMRSKLGDLLEGGWVAFYFSCGFVPALVGFVCGRWMPVWVRCIPLSFILTVGVCWVFGAGHSFEIYLFGNIVYVALCTYGLSRRARAEAKPFWSLRHFDWIAVAGGSLVIAAMYVKPTA